MGNRLLPEHSMVPVISCRGRAFKSASLKRQWFGDHAGHVQPPGLLASVTGRPPAALAGIDNLLEVLAIP
jgi:hypothetical protein